MKADAPYLLSFHIFYGQSSDRRPAGDIPQARARFHDLAGERVNWRSGQHGHGFIKKLARTELLETAPAPP